MDAGSISPHSETDHDCLFSRFFGRMSDSTDPRADGERQMLRHTLATLAYRGGKVLRGAPADFDKLKIADGGRTVLQIVAHIGDLLEWALSLAKGEHVWAEAPPRDWREETERFFQALTVLDKYLAENPVSKATAERLFQGPIADALTHVGQIAMLRRLAGAPVRGENYAKATVTVGRTGADQPPPVMEFD